MSAEYPSQTGTPEPNKGMPSRRKFLKTAVTTTVSAVAVLFTPNPMSERAPTNAPDDGHASNKNIDELKMMTPEEVGRTVCNRVKFVKARDVLHQCEHCVDGRDNENIVGEAGGDAGIGAAALCSIEKQLGRQLSRPEIRAFVRAQEHGFIHTDDHMNELLHKALTMHPTLNTYASQDVAQLVENGTRNREANGPLAVLVRQNLGCGHLKNMMADAQAYGVRRELVEMYIEELLLWKWDDAGPVTVKTLKGPHAERAVAVLASGDLTRPDTKVATVNPNGPDGQMFVAHTDVSKEMLRTSIERAAEAFQAQGIDLKVEDAVSRALTTLERQRGETVNRLAPGRKVVGVDFTDPAHPQVKVLAEVPNKPQAAPAAHH